MNSIFLFFWILTFPLSLFSTTNEDDCLTGTVVTQINSEYFDACQIFNNTKNILEIRPSYIVYCNFIEDVVNAIKWAQIHSVQVSIRSGGHSYEGFSLCNGLVIDLSSLNQINISKDLTTVKVGAGCRLNDIYKKLWKYKRTIVGGSCGSVGISGFTLGGGFGFLSRKYGLAIDNLIEIELVNTHGKILIANKKKNSDLFWACRGGGGGNFGVVTSLTFKTIPIEKVVFYQIVWPWEEISDVIKAWQSWAPQAPEELTSILLIPLKKQGGLTSTGIYLGDEEELCRLLNEKLLCAGHPQTVTIQTMSWGEALKKLHSDSGGNKCAFKAKSDFVRKPFTQEAIATIMEHLGDQDSKIECGMLILDSYGGTINQIPEEETAFVHRKEQFSIQYLTYWNVGDEEAECVNREWINSFYQKMRSHVSGFSYQNYIDKDLENWMHTYYGINEERLKEIKFYYDPNNFFKFDQSIPLPNN